MKKQENEVRKIFVKIRMNKTELQQLKKLQQQSTERSLSNYIRKLALQKPIIVRYRNQSADEFLAEMIRLKRELNAIGNNFNQVVHKLHILERIPEFRKWIMENKILQENLARKVGNIEQKMNEIHQQWLLK